MFYYRAFELNIACDFELPRLKSTAKCQADIHIKLAKVSASGLEKPVETRAHLQFAPNQVWLHIDQVARFLMSDGRLIEVEPYPNADMQSVCLYVLGSGLGAILHQRQQLVLHGNAIRIGNQSIIFVGPSGRGKSTLAAAFYQKGYDILADDLAVIDAQNRVLPSYPQIKLWQDSADHMTINTQALERIRLQVSKFEYPINSGFCEEPLAVYCVYVLQTHKENEFLFEEMVGPQKIRPLRNQTYRLGYVKGMGRAQSHFQQCADLASQIRVVRLTRPEEGFQLEGLVQAILDDL